MAHHDENDSSFPERQARRAVIAPGAAAGIDEALVQRVVHAFYDRIRGDDLLGPIFDRVIGPLLGYVAGILLFCLMTLTCIDVIGRYFFNTPVTGGFELTEMMLAALIFFGLSLLVLLLSIPWPIGPGARSLFRGL